MRLEGRTFQHVILSVAKDSVPSTLRATRGVSLITVLLFMLVATIAATATYKWLTSEGRSSSSRMLEREAYQSSVAGLENARTWMTYHANDVGDLIHQFIAGGNKPINIDGRLRTLQRAGQNYHVWMTGVNTDNPTYKVKLVSYGEARGNTRHAEAAIFNVDGLYRVETPAKKFSGDLSFEEAFFGSLTGGQRFDVSAGVFNGNLKVNTSVKSTGHVIITGNFDTNSDTEFNNLYVKGHVCSCTKFRVKGNARFEQLFYPGGGALGLDALGNNTGGTKIDGDLYLDNGINLTSKAICAYQTCDSGDLYVGKNVSSYGDVTMLNTSSGQKATQIQGNLVVNNSKQIIFPTKSNKASGPWMKKGDGYSFKVLGNVFVDNGFNEGMHGFYYAAPDVAFGSTGKTVYIPGQYRISTANGAVDQTYSFWYDDLDKDVSFDYGSCNYHRLYLKSNDLYYNCYKGTSAGQNYTDVSWPLQETKLGPLAANTFCNRDKCSPTGGNGDGKYYGPFTYPYFQGEGYIRNDIFTQINGSYTNSKPTDTIGWGADPLTKYQNMVTTETEGNCTGAHVSDPIQFNKQLFDKTKIGNKLHNEDNPGACDIDGLWGKDGSIDRWNLLETCYDKASAANELYDGEWLIIEFYSDVTFATLDANTPDELTHKYIIKFNNAYSYGQSGLKLIPTDKDDGMAIMYFPNGGSIQPSIGAGNKANYFFYGENQINYNNNADTLTGSIFMSNCSAFNVSGNNNVKAIYNPQLTEALRSSGVICNYNGQYVCSAGGPSSASSGSSSGSTGTTSGGPDAYFISMAPQLGVTLESQNETSESFSESSGNVTTLAPSFIVLPRIIYLPSDPYGKLSDYYSILPLNGSTLKKNDVTIETVSGSERSCSELVGTTIVSGGAKLTKNAIYSCAAKAAGHQDVPFWVVIGDDQRSTPSIHFLESEASQQAPTSTTSPLGVHVYVSAHANQISLSVTCPSLGGTCATNAAGKYYCQGGGWTYELQNGGQRSADGVCTFTIPASADADQTSFSLFNVSTENASNGTVTFHLQQIGTDYSITSPYSAELHVSSTTTVNRTEATPDQITAWCANSTDCPSDVANWPDMNCSSDRTDIDWVDLTGTSNKGTISPNQRWSVGVGGTEEISLISAYSGDECLVIIPTGDKRSLAGVAANGTIAPLHATLKPKKKTLTVGFTGKLDGKNPKIIVNAGTSISDAGVGNRIVNAECIHDNISGSYPKYCSYDVFPGEKVTFKVDDVNSKKFNYWKCESGSCPNLESLNNKNYTTTPITISSGYTYTYLAHFGESDKHCFFEEFKDGDASEYNRANRGTLACSNGVEYCIDDCSAQSGCATADNTSGYKWRLIGSPLSSLDYSSLYGYLTVKSSLNKGRKESEKTKIVVMSSVNAGLNGDMKALVQIPSAAAHGKDSRNIRGSGIILRSNNTASEYLMVNVYANNSGKLEAQVCKNGGPDCLESKELKSGGSSVSVNSSNMAMVTATLSGSSLTVSAVTDPHGYYGQAVTSYSHTFDVSSIAYNDRTHEYVGFSIADANFKIHGIGWHSGDYNADCFDTYPAVKCSFAAVADSGFIPTGKWVKPWVGYSGWFSSSGTCTEKLYYYNGSDANCGSSSNNVGVLCGDNGYKFDANTTTITTNEGPHGYQDANSKDVKTAKAWLNCPTKGDLDASWWSSATESEFAHCGYFWTGEYQECANDQANLLGSTPVSITAGAEGFVPLVGDPVGAPINLRKSSLNITLQDNSGEVEIWLESPNTGECCWGGCEDFPSASVTVTGNTASFDVVKSFPADSTGFNPEEVSRIRIKNHGTGTVKVTGVSAACTNAIDITSCKADYSESDGQWNIEMTVTNRKNITTKQYKANYLNSGDYTDGNYSANTSAGGVPCKNDENSDNKIICSDKSRDPYESDQGETYEFAVKVTGNRGLSTVEKTGCTVTPDKIKTISCSVPNVGPVVTSGQPLPQFNFTLSNCPGGSCDYEIYLGTTRLNDCGNGQSCSGSGTGEIAKTPVGTATECTNPNGCTQTYTVKSSNASKPFEPCSRTFTVNPRGYITASCAFSPAAVGKGAEAKLALINIQNVETATNISVTCSNCPNGYTVEPSPNSLSTNDNGKSKDIKFYAPDAVHSGYTYSVEYTPPNSTTSRPICSSTPTLAVVDGLSCSNVSPPQIYLGQTFTFTPAGGGTCTSASLSKNNDGDVITAGSGSPCPTSYTVKPATIGNSQEYPYTFEGSINGGCNAVVNVLAPPDFSCPTNTPSTVGEDVTIELTGISGCGEGCTVTVSPSVTIKNSSGTVSSSETSHSLVFDGSVTSAPTDPVEYEVTLTGDVGTTKTCPVTYTSGVTSCNDRISWAPNSGQTPDNTGGGSWTGIPQKAECFDIDMSGYLCTGSFQLKMVDCKGETINWNGASVTLLSGNDETTGIIPAPGVPIKISAPKECTISKLYFTDCSRVSAATAAPSITCPTSSQTSPIIKGTGANTNVSVSNCAVVGGCSYTITKGGSTIVGPLTTYGSQITIPGDDAPGGPYTYVLSVSNSQSGGTPSTCEMHISYQTVQYYYEDMSPDDEKTFVSGKTYKIKCVNPRSFKCMTTDNSYSTFTFGTGTGTANPGYWGASTSSCPTDYTTLETEKTITCKNMW